MSFKLIKEAHTISKIAPEQLGVFEELKTVLGKDSITAVLESFTPADADYAKWLEVIIGYAQDAGTPLKSKADFQDIAFAVLENDPIPVPFEMQEAIVNRLWLNFKATKHDAKIQKIAAARVGTEEEERATTAEICPPHCKEFMGDEDQVDDEVIALAKKATEEEEKAEKVEKKDEIDPLTHAITRPRDEVSQALKDIETEGGAAWKAMQLPQNPHPKKSMAYKAWEKGMKGAIKDHFGFERPTQSTSKQKKK
jgi:hypothetical protein